MKSRRLNRSLNSIKSLAPYYLRMRVSESGTYDFTCRRCGQVLEPEKSMFGLIHTAIYAGGSDEVPQPTVKSVLEDLAR